MRALLALLLLAGPLLGQAVNGWAPIENSWSEIQTPAATGTVTTTSTLVSGRVALSSGASSLTDDAGCTWAGTGPTFSVNVASGTNAIYLGGGAALFGSPTGGIGLGLNYVTLGTNLNSTAKHTWVNSSNILTGAVDLALSRPSTGLLLVEDGSGNPRDVQARTVLATGTVRLKGYTVATLPAGTVGDTAYCTDLTTPTFMAVAVGGGAVVGKVFFDGTNWITQ